MIIVSNDSIDASDVASVDFNPLNNPVHAAYAGAAVVGGTVVVGSVGLTTMVAPGLVLVPGAVAAGLCAYASYETDRRTKSDDTDAKPASDEPVAA